MLLMQFKQDYAQFRRAIPRTDQRALDELFVDANKHVAEVGYASHPIPSEMFMLAMLLEMHREVMRLRALIEEMDK
jgi:hypothetical protein